MRILKRITGLVLAVCMAAAIMVVPNTEAYAKAKVSTKNADIIVNSSYSSLIKVTYSKGDAQIKNIKTSSKNLIARQTNQYWRKEKNSWSKDAPYGYADIGLYGTKKGTYKLTFDVCNEEGKKRSSHSVKVVVSDDLAVNYPIMKATFNGKTDAFWSLSNKSSGKFKVVMNKGYKLKSITMTTYDAKGNNVTKKIKNNKKVKLGQYAYLYENDYEYQNWGEVWNEETGEYDRVNDKLEWSYYLYAHVLANTTFTITYQNTKTKSVGTTSYTIYTIPKN